MFLLRLVVGSESLLHHPTRSHGHEYWSILVRGGVEATQASRFWCRSMLPTEIVPISCLVALMVLSRLRRCGRLGLEVSKLARAGPRPRPARRSKFESKNGRLVRTPAAPGAYFPGRPTAAMAELACQCHCQRVARRAASPRECVAVPVPNGHHR